MFLKSTRFFPAIFLAFVFLNTGPSTAESNGNFIHITDEKKFRRLVVGRILSGECTIVIEAENKIAGKCKKGGAVEGTWEWSDGYFCRTVTINGKVNSDCQKFEVNLATQKTRTTSQKTKKVRVFNLTDILVGLSVDAPKDSTLNNPPAASSTMTKTASASETTTSAVTVATTPTSSTVSVSASSTKWRNAKDATQAQRYADEIQASIIMFMAISDVIKEQPLTTKDRVLSVVDSEIVRLQQEKQLLQDQLSSRFSTPIRPNNANLSVSAFRAADTFPKIPFYVPGTNEIGEMLIVPRVSDEGFLNYQFDFLDPTSTYDKVRDSIDVAHDDIGALINGLNKVDEWTKVAQDNNVNRRIEKTASCIPDGMCEEKKQGVSSTEVVFQVYEDGSTAGRIQRNKGKFMVGYNMSVESSVLLSAYLIYMRDVGAQEFNIGVMTDDEVKGLFN